MLRYEYLKKEWIVSPTARRVYRASATLSLALFITCWAILSVGRIPETLAPVVRLLLLAGVVGAGITLVGMEFFLFRFDDSHPFKQICWFLIMLIPLLGASLYCFIVYSRSDVVKNTCAKNPEGVSA